MDRTSGALAVLYEEGRIQKNQDKEKKEKRKEKKDSGVLDAPEKWQSLFYFVRVEYPVLCDVQINLERGIAKRRTARKRKRRGDIFNDGFV